MSSINESQRNFIAIDESNVCKRKNENGKHTCGLDKFYNSKAEKGLEIATLALVDVDYKYSLQLETSAITRSMKYIAVPD